MYIVHSMKPTQFLAYFYLNIAARYLRSFWHFALIWCMYVMYDTMEWVNQIIFVTFESKWRKIKIAFDILVNMCIVWQYVDRKKWKPYEVVVVQSLLILLNSLHWNENWSRYDIQDEIHAFCQISDAISF